MGHTKHCEPGRARFGFQFEPLEARRMLSSAFAIAGLGWIGTTLQPEFLNIPLSINNQGQVVGFFNEQNNKYGGYAFLYSNGVETRLSDVYRNFPRSAQPSCITDSGTIVGTYHAGRSVTRWEQASIFPPFPVQVPVNDAFSFTIAGHRFRHVGPFTPAGADASGDIVGSDSRGVTNNSSGYSIAAAFDGKHLKIIGSRRASLTFWALEQNGSAVLSDASGNLFLYNVHTRATSGVVGRLATNQTVTGINTAGQIILSNVIGLDYVQSANAVLLSGGQTTQLGSLGGQSIALGINDAGQIVGTCALSSAAAGNVPMDAFVFSNGQMTDLNVMAPPAETGWTIVRAEGINNAGQIVAIGQSTSDSTQHALLLTPTARGT